MHCATFQNNRIISFWECQLKIFNFKLLFQCCLLSKARGAVNVENSLTNNIKDGRQLTSLCTSHLESHLKFSDKLLSKHRDNTLAVG